MTARILCGDVREMLAALPDASVQCCVTSPPYFRLRDYGVDGQIGIEATPAAYVAALVDVFREVRRVLRPDGTVFLNLGDSYFGSTQTGGTKSKEGSAKRAGRMFSMPVNARHGDAYDMRDTTPGDYTATSRPHLLKPKDLIGIPWRVAFALQADGWYLRSDIIWHKPNPMPESVTDRPTKSHEYIFLLAKSERYYYDAAAIAEPVALSTVERLSQPTLELQGGSLRANGGAKTNGPMKAVRGSHKGSTFYRGKTATHQLGRASEADRIETDKRNKRSVWTVATQPYSGAHFAVFPTALIEPCILAGSHEGDTVLDPFAGSGTTGVVALRHGRSFVGVELNPTYCQLAQRRITQDAPLFNRCEVT